jgi:large subunit ribosomal protein L18
MNKKESRVRRSLRTRKKIRSLEAVRLCVHKTGQHIYAQVICSDNEKGDRILASASTLEKEIRTRLSVTNNKAAAAEIGKLIAGRALKAGITKVAFDRSGFKYHGRIKSLADAAREEGIQF